MRRFALILLCLAGCLLFAADGAGRVCASVPGTAVADGVPARSAVLTLDRASTEQWLCEQTYNSNLGLPRSCGEVSAPQGSVLTPRGSHSDSGRSSLRLSAELRTVKLQLETAVFNPNLSAGLCAVDYYVYRLRRLII